MVVKLKDGQVYKNIYVKEFLGDQQEEVGKAREKRIVALCFSRKLIAYALADPFS